MPQWNSWLRGTAKSLGIPAPEPNLSSEMVAGSFGVRQWRFLLVISDQKMLYPKSDIVLIMQTHDCGGIQT